MDSAHDTIATAAPFDTAKLDRLMDEAGLDVLIVTSNSLEVSPDWEITHDTTTEYVIVGENKWRSLSGSVTLTSYVTDVTVADEYVYFARGDTDDANHRLFRLRMWNNAGTWTYTTATEAWGATKIKAIRDPATGQKLFGAQNSHPFFGVCVWSANVPNKPGDLYHEIVELAPTDRPWSSRAVGNVTNGMTGESTSVTIAAAFTTGIASVLNLSAPINILNAKYLGVNIKSTVTTAAGDLKLVLSDKKDLGRPTAMTFYNGTTHVGMYAGYDTLTGTNYPLTMTTADYIYIMSESKFNMVKVDLGTTVNLVASVMEAEYWDGDSWAALTIGDDTISPAGTTLGKDGVISINAVPAEWSSKEELVGLSVYEGYWIRLSVTVNLTAAINVVEVTLTNRSLIDIKAAGERVMQSISRFLEKRLHLKVNREKSAVDRPWRRGFLGYTMTWHRQPKLKVSPDSIQRIRGKIRELMRKGRGCSLTKIIGELVPLLRGWMNYFRLSSVKIAFEELDGWIRRKLRCVIWRHWKKPITRAKKLIRRGIERERAYTLAYNGRGAWWNSGAAHMPSAFPAKWFTHHGLISLLSEHRRFQKSWSIMRHAVKGPQTRPAEPVEG